MVKVDKKFVEVVLENIYLNCVRVRLGVSDIITFMYRLASYGSVLIESLKVMSGLRSSLFSQMLA